MSQPDIKVEKIGCAFPCGCHRFDRSHKIDPYRLSSPLRLSLPMLDHRKRREQPKRDDQQMLTR